MGEGFLDADDFYDHLEEALEDDEISAEEEGFMRGFVGSGAGTGSGS